MSAPVLIAEYVLALRFEGLYLEQDFGTYDPKAYVIDAFVRKSVGLDTFEEIPLLLVRDRGHVAKPTTGSLSVVVVRASRNVTPVPDFVGKLIARFVCFHEEWMIFERNGKKAEPAKTEDAWPL